MARQHLYERLRKLVKRRRYVMNLAAHLAECEANYVRLMRLMPDIQRRDRRTFSLALSGGEPRVRLEVAHRFPYTTVVRIAQDAPGGALGDPASLPSIRFAIRIYHDARSAEVIECQDQRGFQAVYDYPNANMRHPDEKAQVNRFFGEFLAACLQHGVSSDRRVLVHEA